MNTNAKAIVGAVLGLSWVTNTVMAQQAEADKPRQEFKGPVQIDSPSSLNHRCISSHP